MATEEMFTSLPTVATAQMSDIICAVQGYVNPSNLGLSVQESLQQVYNLFQSNIILFNSGNPNGAVAGTTYQFCWDTLNSTLYVCVTSGTSSTAVWVRADINDGYTTTVTAAGTTTLTILSSYWQFFTGSTTQTVVMPLASTLAAGMTWSIVNNSSGAVTIQSSGLNTITTLAAGGLALVTCILNSGTSAASWNASISSVGGGVTSITGTANQVIASASTGAITLSTPQNIATTSSPTFANLTLSNPLTVQNGGTGLASTTAYAVLCGGTTSTAAFQSIASVGTSGQVLTSNGAGALPTMQTLTGTGGLKSFQIFTSGSSATYTKPAGITSILVEVIGGGGGGSGVLGAASSFSSGGGGGSGGYARLYVASASSTYTYTVGAAGAGGTAGANPGGTGGTTTFSASSLQATGGGGGQPPGAPALVSGSAYGSGGTAGVGTNGNINSTGRPGNAGLAVLGNLCGGNGGSSIYGGGGLGICNTTAAGNAAGLYGSGGGGASGTTVSLAGGAGSAGLIIVWEFN